MAHRHRVHRAKGGRVYYAGGESNVAKEAAERKHGGKAMGKHGGHKGHHRLDKRAHGGRVGADKHPFSSAHVGSKKGAHYAP